MEVEVVDFWSSCGSFATGMTAPGPADDGPGVLTREELALADTRPKKGTWAAGPGNSGIVKLKEDDDTIVITYYNAPGDQQWRQHYEQLPARLAAEGVCPTIPWLYNFKLNFRFR